MEFKNKQGDTLPIGKISVSLPYDHINKAYNEGYPTFSSQGGTRSGKTVNYMIWCILMALANKIKVGILRKTFPSLRMSILQDFINVMKQLGQWHERSYNKTEHIYTFDNGSEFWFVAADESEKLKGFTCDIMWMNEATEYLESDYRQLSFRCKKFMILDYNPNFSDKLWLATEINDRVNDKGEYMIDDYTGALDVTIPAEKRKPVYFFISTYKDNPFLEPRQVQVIEDLKEANYSLWLQFGQGRRCLLQGRVFPNLNYISELPADRKIKYYIGIDYGYSNQPTAIVKVGLRDKEMWIQEISYQVDLRTDAIQRILQTDSRCKGLMVIADSANEMMNRDVEEVKSGSKVVSKLNLRRVNKHGRAGAQARLDAVRIMQQYKINITSDSEHVRNEFESYVFKQEKDGSFTNDPVSFNDHSVDACRYIVMEKGARVIHKGIIIH